MSKLSKTILITVGLLGAVTVNAAAQSPHRATTLLVDGPAGTLGVLDTGTGGMPVVLVHSLAGNRTQWNAQIVHLSQSRRVIAYDMRGHGGSAPAPDGDYSLTAMTADLEAVVDAVGLRRFVLIGHSFAGGVVATYAGRHPDRVAGILFVDPIGDQRQIRQQLDIMVQMLQSDGYQQTIESYWQLILANAAPGVAGQVLDALRQTRQEAVIGAYEAMVTFDPATALRAYDGPMLSVISDFNDFPFSLHNVIPRLPSRTMTKTSHWLQMDRPEQFNRWMDEFLASVKP